jgi:hypothetical protein
MCFFSFLLGVALGVGGFIWFQIGGIVPPAPQDTTRMEVSISKLAPDDQWLQKVHFQVVPLSDVRSVYQYYLILMTPPDGGVQAPAKATSVMYLTSSTDNVVQPFGVSCDDFGRRGDQPVLKLIEGGISLRDDNTHLEINSSFPNR